MEAIGQERKVHSEKLLELGFSPKEVAAAEAMERAGLYDMEPSEDLVERTIRRCADSLRPEGASSDEVPLIPLPGRILEGYASALKELSPALLDLPEWNEFSRLQELQQACLATVHFAHARRIRPVVMLDNHNLFEPSWWDVDTGFRGIRSACQIANKAAVDDGVQPSAVAVVLRPNVEDYSPSDLEAIDSLLHSCTSDLWWIPFGNAGKYQGLNCIVLGEERVLVLEAKQYSPSKALKSFQESRNLHDTVCLRGQLENFAHTGTQILIEGHLTKEAAKQIDMKQGIRQLLYKVISEGCPVTYR
jgi:hypothetical protein